VDKCLNICVKDPWLIADNPEEEKFDIAMGRLAVEIALNRHAGTLEVVCTPFGSSYIQYGKDLTQIPLVIGTGGILAHHSQARKIMEGILFEPEEPTILKPQKPSFFRDKEHILAAMGLLREFAPQKALRMLKKYVVKLKEENHGAESREDRPGRV
jgi:uncharacterized protein (TIGR01319 family)